MEMKYLAALFLCITLQSVVKAQNEETQMVGIIGGSVTFTCDLPRAEEAQIAWKDKVWNKQHGAELIFNSSISMDIASTHGYKDEMEVNEDFQLTIHNLLSGEEELNTDGMSSDGSYYCYSLYEGKWHEQTFHLDLLDKPMCEGDIKLTEGESTTLTCSAVFKGKFPSLQWYRNGQEVNSRFEPEFDQAMSYLEINSATYMDDEAIFTCRMSLGEKNEECQLTLDVGYMVRDMKLTPMDDVIRLDQEIRCSARGNPQPKITFEPESEGAYSGKGFREMEVDKAWLNKLTTVTCRAENTFDGKLETIEKSITFNVTVPKSEPVSADASHNSVSILALVSSIFGLVFASLL